MKNTFTEQDVLRFAYNECSDVEMILIEEEINRNVKLRMFYNQILELKEKLNKFHEWANPSSIELVLEYSHSLSGLEETSSR